MKGRLPNGTYANGHVPWNKSSSGIMEALLTAVLCLITRRK